MNYLIFGGSGFIGSHLAEYVAGRNANAESIYNFDLKAKEHTTEQFIFADVRKPITLKLKDISSSIIFNLAAVHVTPGHANHEYFETNIWGAENICDFARQNNIDTIVFTSSISPYGVSEETKTELTLPMPNTPYGISKLTAEYIHKIWQSEKPDERKLIIVRPGVVFGKNEGGNFTRLYNSLKRGVFFYPGRKNTIKAAVYVKDVVRILFDAAMNELPGVVTLNLTYFPAPSIQEICKAIADVTKVKESKIVIPSLSLKFAAGVIYSSAKLFGKTINGIHPDRVKKLMVSTNISGEKLISTNYKLQFNLEEAITDWFNDCKGEGLY
jgi:GlcNAc-P-P-Und epimerase